MVHFRFILVSDCYVAVCGSNWQDLYVSLCSKTLNNFNDLQLQIFVL